VRKRRLLNFNLERWSHHLDLITKMVRNGVNEFYSVIKVLRWLFWSSIFPKNTDIGQGWENLFDLILWFKLFFGFIELLRAWLFLHFKKAFENIWNSFHFFLTSIFIMFSECFEMFILIFKKILVQYIFKWKILLK